MDKRFNLIAGIICFFLGIIYLIISYHENSIPYAIGFLFWLLAGFYQMDTYRVLKRRIAKSEKRKRKRKEIVFVCITLVIGLISTILFAVMAVNAMENNLSDGIGIHGKSNTRISNDFPKKIHHSVDYIMNVGKVPEREQDLDFWLKVTKPETEEQIAEEERLGQLELLSQIVHAEAGNQDLTGKRLVVDVVLNRVDSPKFPNTIEEVIFQQGQFQPMDDGAFWKAAWNMQPSDYEAVWMEVNGSRIDPGILYFSTEPVNGTGHWKYGDHWFSY